MLFEGPGAGRGIRPGVLTDAGVVDVSSATTELAASALLLPLDVVRLPLPRPGKILCCVGNYWEHAQRETRPLNMFLKNPDAVIGLGAVEVQLIRVFPTLAGMSRVLVYLRRSRPCVPHACEDEPNIRSLSTGALPAGYLIDSRIAAICSQALPVRSNRIDMSYTLHREMLEGHVK